MRRVRRRPVAAPPPPALPKGLIRAKSLASSGRPVLIPHVQIYIDDAAGRLTVEVEGLINRAYLLHCSIHLAELALRAGSVSPMTPDWQAMKAHYDRLLKIVPPSRVLVPDEAVRREAAALSETLADESRMSPAKQRTCLNEALLYLTAAKAEIAILAYDTDMLRQIHALSGVGRCVLI